MSTKIDVINQDITTKEGWDNYVKECLERTAKRGGKEEIRLVDVALICTHDPLTEKPLPRPGAVVIGTIWDLPDDQVDAEKDRFAMLTRSMAILGRAVGSIFTSEAWVSLGVTPGSPAAQMKPRDNPERKEALTVMVQHREFGSGMHMAIIDMKDGKRSIGEWTDSGYSPMGGRFARFIPPEAAMNDPMTIALARVFVESQLHTMERFDFTNERKHA